MKLGWALHLQLGTERCLFRTLSAEDVTDSYVSALQHQREYLTSNPESITLQWQQDYVRSILASVADTIAGLFVEGILVGTTGMQGIREGGVSTIGVFVLSPERRGRGYGKTLVWAASAMIGRSVRFERVEAGTDKSNEASLRSFLACGFSVRGETPRGGIRLSLTPADLRRPASISGAQFLPVSSS
jgi:RimJ/RimL family protein N-acetyltransferase